MLEDKLFKLCVDLFNRTKQSSVKWTETAEDDSFRAILRNALVRVERHEDPQITAEPEMAGFVPSLGFALPHDYKSVGGFVYSLIVFDDRNKQIARFIPNQIEKAQQVRDLWELAFRSARNSEQKIDDLLHELRHLTAKST